MQERPQGGDRETLTDETMEQRKQTVDSLCSSWDMIPRLIGILDMVHSDPLHQAECSASGDVVDELLSGEYLGIRSMTVAGVK